LADRFERIGTRQSRQETRSNAMPYPTDFFSALLAIVIIDLVLAGDNAIVIALAARGLPGHLQKRAIVWGTLGAVAVRVALTAIVVWLLKVPGLPVAGGLLLAWIGYRLLLPGEKDAGERAKPAATLWSAIRTVVIADAVMGLDNVLAVAGAARGSYLLVVLGLVISIPIVVWGSTVILRFVERLPVLVYIGAGVIVSTAVKMIVSEPLLQPWMDPYPGLPLALQVLIVPAVLWAGFVKNHRQLESRIHARLARFAGQRRPPPRAQSIDLDEDTTLRILIPVDGSRNAENAVRHAVREYRRGARMEIHLLNVQPPFSRHIAAFVSKGDRAAFHREQSQKALRPAAAQLDTLDVPYFTHTAIGGRARTITEMADRLGCERIVAGTARKSSLTRMLEDSVTNDVLQLTRVPVEVVAGGHISPVERYGVPAGLAIALGMLLLALE
jgi:YjbE family integral membrane protein